MQLRMPRNCCPGRISLPRLRSSPPASPQPGMVTADTLQRAISTSCMRRFCLGRATVHAANKEIREGRHSEAGGSSSRRCEAFFKTYAAAARSVVLDCEISAPQSELGVLSKTKFQMDTLACSSKYISDTTRAKREQGIFAKLPKFHPTPSEFASQLRGLQAFIPRRIIHRWNASRVIQSILSPTMRRNFRWRSSEPRHQKNTQENDIHTRSLLLRTGLRYCRAHQGRTLLLHR